MDKYSGLHEEFLIPCGPYFDFQFDDGAEARSKPILQHLDLQVTSACDNYGSGQEPEAVGRKMLRYICAGLMKHEGLAGMANTLDSESSANDSFEMLRMSAESAIQDAFISPGKVTLAQKEWMALEQRLSVSLVTEYSEVLMEVSNANNGLLDRLISLCAAEKFCTREQHIGGLFNFQATLKNDYINLAAYARSVEVLNTTAPRFKVNAQQQQLKQTMDSIIQQHLAQTYGDCPGTCCKIE